MAELTASATSQLVSERPALSIAQVPCKQRLVALLALLHSKRQEQRGGGGAGKVVVFAVRCSIDSRSSYIK